MISPRMMDGIGNAPSCRNVATLLIIRARELTASVDRNAPFAKPYAVKASTLSGPVESTIPVRNPTIAPVSANCHSRIRNCRA